MSNDNEELVQDELTTLKARATMLGLSFHPSIGLEKLRDKVNAAQRQEEPGPDAEESPAEEEAPPVKAPETETQKRIRMKQEALRLVRIRVTCMNPAKTEWSGEIFTVGNATIGSVKKFIPFNAEDGWHVPHIMYQALKARQCQIFVTSTDARGNKSRKGKLIREFAIEVMPDLDTAELAALARRQAMAKSVD